MSTSTENLSSASSGSPLTQLSLSSLRFAWHRSRVTANSWSGKTHSSTFDSRSKATCLQELKTKTSKFTVDRVSPLFLEQEASIILCSSLAQKEGSSRDAWSRSLKTEMWGPCSRKILRLLGQKKRWTSWETSPTSAPSKRSKTWWITLWSSAQHREQCTRTTFLQQSLLFIWFILHLLRRWVRSTTSIMVQWPKSHPHLSTSGCSSAARQTDRSACTMFKINDQFLALSQGSPSTWTMFNGLLSDLLFSQPSQVLVACTFMI